MAQSVLELLFRTKKTGDGAQQAQKEAQGFKQTTGETSKSLDLLTVAGKMAEGAIIGLGLAFLHSIPSQIEAGIAYDRAQQALIGYSGSAQEAEAVTAAVSEAAGGALTEMAAMQSAARLLAMGLADDAEEAANLTEMAITLGASMGKGPQQAFEEFTLLLANQSILRLDTFGISGAVVRQRMEELAKATGETDRQLLFLNATMEEGNRKMGQLDEAGFEATSNWDRLKAVIGDTTQQMANGLADGLMPYIDGHFRLEDAMKNQAKVIADTSENWDEYYLRMANLRGEAPLYARYAESMTEEQFKLNKVTQEYSGELDAMQAKLLNHQQSLGETTTATEGLWTAQDLLNVATKTYSDLLLFQTASESMSAEAALALGRQLGVVDEKTILAYMSVETLTEKYDANKDGIIDLTEYLAGYNAEIARMKGLIEALPDEKYVQIIFDTQGGGILNPQQGNPTPYQHGGSFVVQGRPGPDRVPTTIWATAGETVTVTPQGHMPVGVGGAGGAGITIQNLNLNAPQGVPARQYAQDFINALNDYGRQARYSNLSALGK